MKSTTENGSIQGFWRAMGIVLLTFLIMLTIAGFLFVRSEILDSMSTQNHVDPYRIDHEGHIRQLENKPEEPKPPLSPVAIDPADTFKAETEMKAMTLENRICIILISRLGLRKTQGIRFEGEDGHQLCVYPGKTALLLADFDESTVMIGRNDGTPPDVLSKITREGKMEPVGSVTIKEARKKYSSSLQKIIRDMTSH